MAPAWQETPEHFEDIEKEMAGIRSQMAPDLSDLRKYAEPTALKERVRQDLQGRVFGTAGIPSATAAARREPRTVAALVALAVAAVLVVRRASSGSDR